MVDEQADDKEALDLKKYYIHYLGKKKEITQDTQFKVSDVFDNTINRDSIPPEQITKLNNL